jgi:hypothetical protein
MEGLATIQLASAPIHEQRSAAARRLRTVKEKKATCALADFRLPVLRLKTRRPIRGDTMPGRWVRAPSEKYRAPWSRQCA